jgi:hypothetical protein
VALLRRTLWLVALAAPWSCHQVFDGELGPVRCSDEGAYGPPACHAGETCTSGYCSAIGLPLGSACTTDAECAAPGACIAVGDRGGRCTMPCCASTDCGPIRHQLVCWQPEDLVGGVCWPAAEIGRPPPGERDAHEVCAQGGECRSGLCDGSRCLDGCCDDSYCVPQEVCRLKDTAIAEHDTFTCAPPTQGGSGPECDNDIDCPSGTCLIVDAMNGAGFCVEPCCGSDECGSVVILGAPTRIGCVPYEGVRACAELLDPGAVGEVGAACQENEDCLGSACLGEGDLRYCSDTCCDDASCGDESAFRCRPVEHEGVWALRCVRK